MSKVHVQEITIISLDGKDYISLTDMIKGESGDQLIKNWLRNKNTIEYLGVWEKMFNPRFNLVEFDLIRIDAGTNRFTLSAKQWIDRTNAIGITSKAGRYGGTYAHKDLAFEFGMWVSPEFKLLLVTEFQRLKDEENKKIGSEWDFRRFLAKTNYSIHTDAIKVHVLPALNVSKDKEWVIYANEADILNVALFGCTAKEWKEKNTNESLKGLNIRDFADAHQLLVLSNLENLNAAMMQNGTDKYQRLLTLRKNAEFQLNSLRNSSYTIEKIQSPFKKISSTTTGGGAEIDNANDDHS